MTRPRWIMAGLAALMALGAVAQLLGPEGAPAPSPAEVHARVQQWQLSEEQRSYEQVRWSEDPVAAVELSRKSGRPLLMFYSEGPLGRG